MAISRVRGIGVADMASTSTAVRSRLSCSLCSTPNRCSSSMITKPRSANSTSLPSSRWVPTTTSTLPSLRPSSVARVSASVWKRLSGATLTGKPAYRSAKVAWCCWTSSVVGNQDRHLLAVLDRLERRPHRDLGLAVADVAADQPVHRHDLFHVPLDLVDGGQLVRGLDEAEGVLELALPGGVGRERVAPGGLPGSVELDQLGGDLAHGLAGPALALGPVAAAHLVQGRALAADVAGDLVE